MEVSLALFVYLVFHIIIFKHEILFVPVMFVKLSLLFWGQLLSQMMSTCLSQRYDSGFFLAGSLSNLHVWCSSFYDLTSAGLILLPILYLYSLTLLIEMMVQQQWSRKLFFFLSLQLLGNLLVLLYLDVHLRLVFSFIVLLLLPSPLHRLLRNLWPRWSFAFFLLICWRFILVS